MYRIPTTISRRTYAISLHSPKPLPSVNPERTRKSLKGFQYSLYESILTSKTESPIVFLIHDSFTANRIIQVRQDIIAATRRLDRIAPLPAAPLPDSDSTQTPPPPPRDLPKLTFVKSSVLGACLRNIPVIRDSPDNLNTLQTMIDNVKYGYALLTFPAPFDPPQLAATLKAIERSVPPRPPKPQEEIDREEALKKADPIAPGKRSKRQRTLKTPDMRVAGALVAGKVYAHQGVVELGKLPTLQKLREQLVGLLSQPGMQLTAILNEAGGAKLARTLEGLQKSLEEQQNDSSSSAP